MLVETHESPEVEELRQLGDEIATLAAQIEVARSRLLEMIREFDVRVGWGNGFQSCAHWLNYRIGLGLHAAREQVPGARWIAPPRISSRLNGRRAGHYTSIRTTTAWWSSAGG